MSKILPINPDFNGITEKKFYYYLKNYLNEGDIAYYNYSIHSSEFDFCLLRPGKGILLIELKGWNANNIQKVQDNMYVQYRNSYGEMLSLRSPYQQSLEYTKKLLKELKARFNLDVLTIPVVAYANISYKEFKEKRLDILSEANMTIFKEDLTSKENLNKKIDNIFSYYAKNNMKHFDTFNKSAMIKVRSIWEDIDLRPFERGLEKKKRSNYSMLYIIDNDDINSIEIETLVDKWFEGTKIIIITNSKLLSSRVFQYLDKKINDKKISKYFKLKPATPDIFLFNFYLYYIEEDKLEELIIKDGSNISKDTLLYLKKMDQNSNFNLGQYLVEHASNQEDIIVKAGAGTGKTFTMINRIMFLIYKDNIKAKDLPKKIGMITFTNEAAESMKEKIRENLMNYFLLTGDYNYFEMIGIIETMNISTIHSFVYSIIKKFSYKLGLGVDVRIIKGSKNRKEEIMDSINSILKEDSNMNKVLSLYERPIFTFVEIIDLIMEKIKNKNIDIQNHKQKLDFGYSENGFNYLIESIIYEVEEKLNEFSIENNIIFLSDLLLILRKIFTRKELKELKSKGHVYDYLFVDEFQDTDNVQIETLSEFKNILDFKLFVVGDIKQSIYRFRGAEDDAFDVLEKNTNKFTTYTLYKNYRTYGILLDHYDTLFSNWPNHEFPYGEKDRIKSNLDICSESLNYKPFKKILVEEDEKANKLKDILLEEYDNFLESKELGQIAILTRTNREVKEVLELNSDPEIRSRFQIKGLQTGDLYRLESTIDFYKLILALINHNDVRYIYNLYTTSYVKNRDILNFNKINLLKKDKEKLHEYLVANLDIPNWPIYIEKLNKEITIAIIRKILNDVKPWNNYADYKTKDNSDNKAKDYYRELYKTNLYYLLELIGSDSNIDYITLNKIERHLSINIKTGQNMENKHIYKEEGVEVLCTTVHKSKGLEYDVVILPYIDNNMGNTFFDDIIIDEKNGINNLAYKIKLNDGGDLKEEKNNHYKNLEYEERKAIIREELRILYVAMTRAKKKFIALGTYDDSDKCSKQNKTWSQYLWEELYEDINL